MKNPPNGGSPSRNGIKSLERLYRVCITPYVLTQSINTRGPKTHTVLSNQSHANKSANRRMERVPNGTTTTKSIFTTRGAL